MVNLQLKEPGARLFDEYAADHLYERFAIVLDGEVIMAPMLSASRFDGQFLIDGGFRGFSPSETQSLVTVLKYGSLPLDIREVSFGAC